MIRALLFVAALLVALCSLAAVVTGVFSRPVLASTPATVLDIPIEPGIVLRSATVDGIPLDVFTPAGLLGPAPAVVLAHGLDGSKERMFAFANALVRSGFVVVAFDFSGHGDNHNPFP
ncbi:MAG: hypothetical protein E6J26_05600, partial [Chloroflexi bacterium]